MTEGWRGKENDRLKILARRRKIRMVLHAGGCCQMCGYDKSVSALEFHHRDRDKKCFPLTGSNCYRMAWSEIVHEMSKCDLLCSNCHRMVEEEMSWGAPQVNWKDPNRIEQDGTWVYEDSE